MKNCYVSGLCQGARVDDVFLISSKSLAESRNGSLYIRLQLADRTGSIDGFKWDADEETYNQLSSDEFVHVRGSVRNFNGKLQVDIESMRACTHKIDPSDFIARSDKDTDEMIKDVLKLVASVRHPHLKALLDHFFADKEFLERFTTAPAAQKIHHAYIGGLLEHSLSTAKMCDFVSSHFTNIDRDLLITGALIHDIGKVEEFNWDKSIKYSDSGHFIGHVVSGAMMVEKAAEKIDGFHPLLKLKITHMVIAHHGQKDWGSPKRPKSIESIILHHVEDLDAKVNMFQQALAKAQPDGESSLWTEKHWVFERPLFRGLPRSIMEPSDIGDSDDHTGSSTLEADFDLFAEE